MARRSAVARRGEVPEANGDARTALLNAAESCLKTYGFGGLSTRRVAEVAGMPLSQIHYHFGSKEALLLALLEYQNRRLLQRQHATFDADLPLWKRWEKACDFLDEDLASGYVRVLQEMTAVGWSNPEVAAAVRAMMAGWYELLAEVAKDAGRRHGGLGPLRPDDVASLVGNAFIGAEALLLLGFEAEGMPIRRALRRVGILLRRWEEATDTGAR
jgi:AcrR family transcriptional regulator